MGHLIVGSIFFFYCKFRGFVVAMWGNNCVCIPSFMNSIDFRVLVFSAIEISPECLRVKRITIRGALFATEPVAPTTTFCSTPTQEQHQGYPPTQPQHQEITTTELVSDTRTGDLENAGTTHGNFSKSSNFQGPAPLSAARRS